MKNMKKLLQKAMVFTLSAAMLVGTPMTASAAELVDLYSISDGTGVVKDDEAPVGTVTNTDTNTGFLIDSNKAEIVDIVLDKQTVKAEKGEKETLKATVVLNGKITATDTIVNKEGFEVCKPNDDITDLVVAEMSKKIKWEVLYVDAKGNKREDMPNPAEKVELGLEVDSTGDRSVVTLNPLAGTKDGEEVTVRATIDAAWHFNVKPAEGESKNWEDRLQNDREQDTDKDAFYTAEAKVSVKEYSEVLGWSDSLSGNSLPLKHTYDLGAKLVRVTPPTANDTITWTSSNKNIPVSKAGVVTAKKVGTAIITAVGEHGAVATRTITVDKGQKADVVKVYSVSGNNVDLIPVTGKTTNKDLATPKDSTMKLTAVMYAKVKAYATDKVATKVEDKDKEVGKEITEPAGTLTKDVEVANGDWYIDGEGKVQQVQITDVITWTSDKKTVATLDADENNATVTLSGVGTAAITAKATNGKSAKTTVKVKASLQTLTISGIEKDQQVYSGQTFNLTALRTPAENKDAVKWSIKKVTYLQGTREKEKANPNASISSKGVLKISNKIDPDFDTVTIHLETDKKVKDVGDGKKEKVLAEDVTIKVNQSTIDTIKVTEKGSTDTDPVAFGGYNSENKKYKGKDVISKTDTINIPLSKTYVASVMNGTTKGDASLLTWKSDKPKVATIEGSGANATIKAVGTGKATITVSGVRLDPKTKKASALSVKFTVQVKQPVTSLTMNKPTVTLVQKDKKDKKGNVTGQADQKVSLKVTFGPKKADSKQTKIKSWTVQKLGEVPVTVTDKNGKDVTKTSISYNLTAPTVGDVFKITATSVTGVTATSTVTVVATPTEVAIANKDETTADGNGKVASPVRFTNENNKSNTADLKIGSGKALQMLPIINLGTAEKNVKPDKPEKQANWVVAGTNKTEQVTYTVDKKGIVTIDSLGRVYPVKKGTVTITAKTANGKKATLKVTVK